MNRRNYAEMRVTLVAKRRQEWPRISSQRRRIQSCANRSRGGGPSSWMNSAPDVESERVVSDGTAIGSANSNRSVCEFGTLDVLGAIGSAVAEVKWQLGVSAQQEWQALASLAQAMWQEERTSTARLLKGNATVSNSTNQIRTLESNFCIKARPIISQKFEDTIRVVVACRRVGASSFSFGRARQSFEVFRRGLTIHRSAWSIILTICSMILSQASSSHANVSAEIYRWRNAISKCNLGFSSFCLRVIEFWDKRCKIPPLPSGFGEIRTNRTPGSSNLIVQNIFFVRRKLLG